MEALSRSSSHRLATLLALVLLLLCKAASAHRIDEYLQATMLSLQPGRIDASMRLIPGTMVASRVIAGIDKDSDGVFSEAEQRSYAEQVFADLTLSIDGKNVHPKLVSWSFPQPAQLRDGLAEIHIEYTADLKQATGQRTLVLTNHHLPNSSVYLMNVIAPEDKNLQIVSQKRDPLQRSFEIDFFQGNATLSQPRGLAKVLVDVQFATLYKLGIRHIAEGTDHLLFLLVLLLPAPLVAVRGRWAGVVGTRVSLGRLVAIITAFTLGHSLTLGLASMGLVHVPERPVEILIALSILISAVHALRPLFAGKEAWIAAFFGLIHGLAFASTLDRLGLARWERLGGILAFNLGIESMQMVVVLLVLPSLLLLRETRAYPLFRICGAILAAGAAIGWIFERLFAHNTPLDTVIDAVSRHGLWLAAAFFSISLLCRIFLANARTGRPRQTLFGRHTTA